MRPMFAVAGIAVLVWLSMPTIGARAQGISIGPGGVYVDPGVRVGPRRDTIGRREAAAIARERGMMDVDSIDRRDDEYIVRGESRRGERMRVVIDAYNGRVIEVVRRD
ncbi:MAG TPA: PepSY domain-containing protein [Xanthobacteraceae bacterium]|nr:PepSY domain-containing protein [Xanthobacteraceae bacterium]